MDQARLSALFESVQMQKWALPFYFFSSRSKRAKKQSPLYVQVQASCP